jgi:hydrogenase maturation protease
MSPRILVIGYGNPGRGDDGLGPALAAEVEAMALPGVTVEADYQLTVDHVPMIAAHDLVVFADAALGLAEPCRLTAVRAGTQGVLGSHQVSPEAALSLAGLLFGKTPPCWMLAIAGTAFGEVREGLSPSARKNLVLAMGFLRSWIAVTAPTAMGGQSVASELPRRGEVGGLLRGSR